MKACPDCQRLYPDEASFCAAEGRPLLPLEKVKVPVDPTDPRIGARICGGRYEVRRRLADGGMGRVYLAVDSKRGRSVAMKVLHADLVSDPIAVERLKREYAFSKQLPHAHIVEVLGLKRTEDKSLAMVMEYLDGEELRATMQRKAELTPARLVRIVSQMALGLTAAHSLKLVHRDLKPDNVFLCGTAEGDHVKILDFGVARDNSEDAPKLTAEGITLGTPYYMSPEQVQGLRSLDHRADVWSMAAILYECLTGLVPFSGKHPNAILMNILTRPLLPPSKTERGASIPAAVNAVLVKALEKRPSDRIGSAAELADRFGEGFSMRGNHHDWAKAPLR